ncbi:hypothetical protein KJ708_01560, partial [bacterium]|nr:hypothetical protein [bacterium]
MIANKNNKKYIFGLFITLFFMSQCSGSGTISGSQKQIIFAVTDISSLGAVDEYSYEMELFNSVDGEKGASTYGPVDAPSYNTAENQYYARIDNVLDGDYVVEFRLVTASSSYSSLIKKVKALFAEDGSDSIALAMIESAITVSGTEISLDLTGSDWATTGLDDDEDGLNNFDEILASCNPLVEDSDGDGVLDGIDAFPVDASVSYDFDGDGVGDEEDDDTDNDG